MKTIFFSGAGPRKSKQVLMQSACSGGTGTFIEKTARKLEIPTGAARRNALHRIHAAQDQQQVRHLRRGRCQHSAEGGSDGAEEIIASLFEAVVFQNLATLTRGNTPVPEILLLGGPNLFSQACRKPGGIHLTQAVERTQSRNAGRQGSGFADSWSRRTHFIMRRRAALKWRERESASLGFIRESKKLRWWIDEGQHEEKKKAGTWRLV